MRTTLLPLLCALFFAVLSGRPVLADENENRAEVTLKRIESVATAVAAYLSDHNAVPDVTTVDALVPLLTPMYIRDLPLRDGWDTPLRYVRLGAQSFQIVSAGADRRFDEKSWSTAAQTEDLAADAVYAVNGQYEEGSFHRLWLGSGGSPLSWTAEEMEELARPLIEAEIEKMKDMSLAQSMSYMRTSFTLRELEALGLFLKAYQLKHGRYPNARSIAELRPMLVPEVGADIPTRDKWGTELRYLVSPDGRSYRVVSAGEDEMFDEASWSKKEALASADDDAVLENGEVVRAWTDDTQPGFGPRAKLQPKARTLLADADARLQAGDHAGALRAYIDAVKADRVAADLEAIRGYAPPVFTASVPPPPPPPPPPGSSAKPAQPARADATPLHIAALRQFLEIHPGNSEAEQDLARLLPEAEALALVSELLKKRPRDPELYRLRSQLRFRAAKYDEGLADLEHAATLAPADAELFYTIGVVSYERAAKGTELSASQKRDLIRRGLAALERAESLRADYFEALTYRNLLLREQAKLESDPAVQQKLLAEADAVRQRALAIVQARRAALAPARDDAAEEPPPPPPSAGPFRVGGDVKPPRVRHRVEPIVPEEARKARVAGIVIIEAVIDKEGRVREARVLKPLPLGLDEAALEALKQWTFEPGTLNGQPVDVIFNLTVNIKPD